eukprot:5305764-Prymnesium_polylepis.1
MLSLCAAALLGVPIDPRHNGVTVAPHDSHIKQIPKSAVLLDFVQPQEMLAATATGDIVLTVLTPTVS